MHSSTYCLWELGANMAWADVQWTCPVACCRFRDGNLPDQLDWALPQWPLQGTWLSVLASSGGWKCTIVGVPWQGSVSASLAWGDLIVKNNVFKRAEKAEPSETPWDTYDDTPTTAWPVVQTAYGPGGPRGLLFGPWGLNNRPRGPQGIMLYDVPTSIDKYQPRV